MKIQNGELALGSFISHFDHTCALRQQNSEQQPDICSQQRPAGYAAGLESEINRLQREMQQWGQSLNEAVNDEEPEGMRFEVIADNDQGPLLIKIPSISATLTLHLYLSWYNEHIKIL